MAELPIAACLVVAEGLPSVQMLLEAHESGLPPDFRPTGPVFAEYWGPLEARGSAPQQVSALKESK